MVDRSWIQGKYQGFFDSPDSGGKELPPARAIFIACYVAFAGEEGLGTRLPVCYRA